MQLALKHKDLSNWRAPALYVGLQAFTDSLDYTAKGVAVEPVFKGSAQLRQRHAKKNLWFDQAMQRFSLYQRLESAQRSKQRAGMP